VLSCIALASILRRIDSDSMLLAVAMACLMLNRHFLSVHELLWSEPWGVASALASIALALRVLDGKPAPVGGAVAAGAAAGLAISVRWAMLAVVAAGLLGFWRGAKAHRRWPLTAAYGLAAAATLALILGVSWPGLRLERWNYLGDAAGRPDIRQLSALANQIVPQQPVAGFLSWGFLLFLLLLAVFGAVRDWDALRPSRLEEHERSGKPRPSTPVLAEARAGFLLSCTALAYAGAILAAPLSNAAAQPTLRISFPLLLFLVPGAISGLRRHTETAGAGACGAARLLNVVLIVGLAIGAARAGKGVVQQLAESRSNARMAAPGGATSMAIAALGKASGQLPKEACLVTNAPGLGWYATRRRTLDLQQFDAGQIERRCGGTPVLVALLVAQSSELQRFVESRESVGKAELCGVDIDCTFQPPWQLATVDASALIAARGHGF